MQDLLKKILHVWHVCMHVYFYLGSRTHLLQGTRVHVPFSKSESLLDQYAVQSSDTFKELVHNSNAETTALESQVR